MSIFSDCTMSGRQVDYSVIKKSMMDTKFKLSVQALKTGSKHNYLKFMIT